MGSTAFGMLTILAPVVFFILSSWVLARTQRETVLQRRAVALDLTLLFGGSTLVGSQLLSAVTHGFRLSGLWGAPAVFVVLVAAYLFLGKTPIGWVSDACAVAAPGALVLGKLGCATVGCCYGSPTSLPWAIEPSWRGGAPPGIGVHPTQLYDCAVLMVAASSAWVLVQRRPRSGLGAPVAIGVMSAGRFLTELTRWASEPPGGPWLTWTQWIVLVSTTASLAVLLVPDLRARWLRLAASREPSSTLAFDAPGIRAALVAGVWVLLLFALGGLLFIPLCAFAVARLVMSDQRQVWTRVPLSDLRRALLIALLPGVASLLILQRRSPDPTGWIIAAGLVSVGLLLAFALYQRERTYAAYAHEQALDDGEDDEEEVERAREARLARRRARREATQD